MRQCDHIDRKQRRCLRPDHLDALHVYKQATARSKPKSGKRQGDIPPKIRLAVAERSGGVCECGCGRRAEHIHHRKLRSQGGRHELANLLHLSNLCHADTHGNPERSYALGLMVHGWCDPADVPVVRRAVAA